MKKIEKKYIYLIIILLLLIILLFMFLFNNKNKSSSSNTDSKTYYHFADRIEEIPGTAVLTSDLLSANHCINNICITNAVIYYNDLMGRVDYTITNNGNSIATGNLKMLFDNEDFLLVAYENLSPSESVNTTSQFRGFDFSTVSDYQIIEFTEKEKEDFIVN